MTDHDLMTMVADITSAHLSHNSLQTDQIPTLIQSIYTSLSELGQSKVEAEVKPEPAVSIRSSIKPDAIICLECGARMKILKRHLGTEHKLSGDDYKRRWNLPADYPLIAPDYAAMRRDLAKTIGLGRKKAVPAKPAPKPRRARTPKPAPAPASEPIAKTAEVA